MTRDPLPDPVPCEEGVDTPDSLRWDAITAEIDEVARDLERCRRRARLRDLEYGLVLVQIERDVRRIVDRWPDAAISIRKYHHASISLAMLSIEHATVPRAPIDNHVLGEFYYAVLKARRGRR